MIILIQCFEQWIQIYTRYIGPRFIMTNKYNLFHHLTHLDDSTGNTKFLILKKKFFL